MDLQETKIGELSCTRFGLGCWAFGGSGWGGQDDEKSLATLTAALEAGITHYDTATAYGDGKSEEVVGQVLKEAGKPVTVASKVDFLETAKEMCEAVDASRQRLGCDVIDLYYIHWPKSGVDLRPAMEGLEQCRAAGKIRAVGVSNFSVEQMEEVAQVGTIDAHQFCYNLYWRFAEKDIIPYCREHHIAGVTYSSIAQGLLTGKFGPEKPEFPEGDQRNTNVLFDDAVYPHLHAATEKMKPLASEAGRELVELAIAWVLQQPGVDIALVGARKPSQLQSNLKAADGEIKPEVFEQLTAISDEAMQHMPADEGNIFRHDP